jgi:bifunctional enzyme CysN/CysC
VGWDRTAFDTVADAFNAYVNRLGMKGTLAVPVSALHGDNIEAASAHAPWYGGPTLVSYLEVCARCDHSGEPLRLPIASVVRPDPDQRLYAGTLASGTVRRGDVVEVAVSGTPTVIDRIFVDGRECEHARAGEGVAVALGRQVDAGTGDVLVHPDHRPQITDQLAAHLVWLGSEPLLPGRDYTLRLGTRDITASVTTIKHRVDVETLHRDAARMLSRHEIGSCTIAAAAPLAVDSFSELPQAGRFVLKDRHTGAIIAAGTVDFALRRGLNVHLQELSVSKRVRARLKTQEPCVVWFTGLSGAGKSTIANLVEAMLAEAGHHTYMLDGDNVRHGLNKDLGFTAADRVENIRRVGEVAKLFVDAGLIVLCSFISPFRAERAAVRGLVGDREFLEVYVRAPLEVCERRDPKGLYAKSRAGRLPNFTGIDSPYEPPETPDLVLDTASISAEELATRVTALLEARGIVARMARRPR